MATIELRTRPSRTWIQALAVLSLGPAVIHLSVSREHAAEWWAFGVFFAALGWFQALWPVTYLARPTARLAGLAIAVNLAVVGVWLWSRTLGLPFGPQPGVPEAVGLPDTVSSVLELALAGGLLLTRPSPFSWPARLWSRSQRVKAEEVRDVR